MRGRSNWIGERGSQGWFIFWQLDGSWCHSSFTICFNTVLHFAFIIINMSFLTDKHRKALRKQTEKWRKAQGS